MSKDTPFRTHPSVLNETDLQHLAEQLRGMVVRVGGPIMLRLFAIDDRAFVHRGVAVILECDRDRLREIGEADLRIRFTEFTKPLPFPSPDWSYFAVEVVSLETAFQGDEEEGDRSPVGTNSDSEAAPAAAPTSSEEADRTPVPISTAFATTADSGDGNVSPAAPATAPEQEEEEPAQEGRQEPTFVPLMGDPAALDAVAVSDDLTTREAAIMQWQRTYAYTPSAPPPPPATPPQQQRSPGQPFSMCPASYTFGMMSAEAFVAKYPAWEPSSDLLHASPFGFLVHYPPSWLPFALAWGREELKRRLRVALSISDETDTTDGEQPSVGVGGGGSGEAHSAGSGSSGVVPSGRGVAAQPYFRMQRNTYWSILTTWIDTCLHNHLAEHQYGLPWEMVSRLIILQERERMQSAVEGEGSGNALVPMGTMSEEEEAMMARRRLRTE